MGDNDGRVRLFRRDGTEIAHARFEDDDSGLTAEDVERACGALAAEVQDLVDNEELTGNLADAYVVIEEDPDWWFNESSRMTATRAFSDTGLARLFAPRPSSGETETDPLSPPATVAVSGPEPGSGPQIYTLTPLSQATETVEGEEVVYDRYSVGGDGILSGTEASFRRRHGTETLSPGPWEFLNAETHEWQTIPHQSAAPETIGGFNRTGSRDGFDVYERVSGTARMMRYRSVDGAWFERTEAGEYRSVAEPVSSSRRSPSSGRRPSALTTRVWR